MYTRSEARGKHILATIINLYISRGIDYAQARKLAHVKFARLYRNY